MSLNFQCMALRIFWRHELME